jgi:acyl-coenzyme A synthetase/AMP-(fatty) acid ligase
VVAEARCVGTPHPLFGEEEAAAVVTRDAVSEQVLIV